MNNGFFQIAVYYSTRHSLLITRACVSLCWTQFYTFILLVVLTVVVDINFVEIHHFEFIIHDHHLTVSLIINTVGFVGKSLPFKANLWDLGLNKPPAALILYLPWLVLDVCKVFFSLTCKPLLSMVIHVPSKLKLNNIFGQGSSTS